MPQKDSLKSKSKTHLTQNATNDKQYDLKSETRVVLVEGAVTSKLGMTALPRETSLFPLYYNTLLNRNQNIIKQGQEATEAFVSFPTTLVNRSKPAV